MISAEQIACLVSALNLVLCIFCGFVGGVAAERGTSWDESQENWHNRKIPRSVSTNTGIVAGICWFVLGALLSAGRGTIAITAMTTMASFFTIPIFAISVFAFLETSVRILPLYRLAVNVMSWPLEKLVGYFFLR
ncbi:MAG: hypothetical protein K2X27_02930 [Candidatus Obscuribacterales bacterium]|nr:hypothetical protein [Candidatus Obscuribacterales bacterium]